MPFRIIGSITDLRCINISIHFTLFYNQVVLSQTHRSSLALEVAKIMILYANISSESYPDGMRFY